MAVYKTGYMWRYAKGNASSSDQMTVRTPNLIRSTSKTFITGLVLKQIDDGLYSLSDTLGSVLSDSDEYALLDKDVINPDVTIEQLLTMTSGIKHIQDYYRKEITELQGNPNWSPIDLAKLVIIDFVSPGTYEYSNTNTTILGLIAEHKGTSITYYNPFLDSFDKVSIANHVSLPFRMGVAK